MHTPAYQPMFRSMSDVPRSAVRWLWPGVIPLGKLTLIAGDPGLGKSFLTIDLAARLSRGGPFPGSEQTVEPASTLLISGEDDPADTIGPRLDDAGADPQSIILLDGVARLRDDGSVGPMSEMSLDEHTQLLRGMLDASPHCKLVVIDPISAYTGQVDSNNNAAVRGLLKPLAIAAQELGVAVVCITHLRKSGEGKAVHRAMGSLAFAAAARTVWMVARDPDDTDRRLLLPVKCNIARDTSGFAFRIIDGRIQWEHAPLAMTADALEQTSGEYGSDRRQGAASDALNEACTFLQQALSTGPVPASHVEEQARTLLISPATLRRARRELGVRAVRREAGHDRAHWAWSLSGRQDAQPPPMAT